MRLAGTRSEFTTGADHQLMLGEYRLERILEREEGSHILYAGESVETGEPVVVKVFAADLDRRGRRAFLRAVHRRAKVEHPALLEVRAAAAGDQLYVVTEPFAGRTLEDRIDEGPLDPDVAVELLGGVAQAVDALGAHNVLYADLTPESIRIDGERPGRVVLVDAGLDDHALGIYDEEDHAGGWLHRHPGYMPPEAVRGERLDRRSAVYSLGCMLYACLTGTPPFTGSATALAYRHAAEDPPRASESRPGLPPELDAVLERALAKNPEERYENATSLIAAAARATGMEAAPVPMAEPEPTIAAEPRPPLPEPLPEPPPSPEPMGPPEPLAPAAEAEAPRAAKAGTRRGLALRAVGALILLSALAVAGYLIGRGEAEVASPRLASAAGLSVTPPEGWAERRPGAAAKGIAPDGALVVGPSRAEEGELVAWHAESSPGRMPAALRPSGGRPPDGVRLGSFEATRQRDLRIGSRSATVFTMPTTEGSLVAVCLAGSGSTAFAPACERVASTLEAPRLSPLSLTRAARERARRRALVSQLGRDRAAGRRTLARAATRGAQARAAHRIARDLRVARSALVKGDGRTALAGAGAALRRAEVAYTGLARAARRGSRRGYASARRRVSGAEASLLRELGRIL